MLGIGQQ
jgi:hypothetical protein